LTDDEGTAVTLAAEPTKIVSMTPAVTETLFAVGAGDRVVATDDSSDYPAEAKSLPDVVTFGTVDVEKIVALAPDLVIAGGAGFTSADSIAQLRALKIPVLVVPPVDRRHLQDIELVGAQSARLMPQPITTKMRADMAASPRLPRRNRRRPPSRRGSSRRRLSTRPARSTPGHSSPRWSMLGVDVIR
jgi:ABC-type hemin transport system substrate-binding protein